MKSAGVAKVFANTFRYDKDYGEFNCDPFTSDDKRSPEREWQLIPLNKAKGKAVVPSAAKLWFISWVDESGNRRSSEVSDYCW